jgi:hypothetical protein
MAEERDLFGGEPVIQFESELDRRNFLKAAKVVGFGASLAFVAAACSKRQRPRDRRRGRRVALRAHPQGRRRPLRRHRDRLLPTSRS